jgi:hypothetical protein
MYFQHRKQVNSNAEARQQRQGFQVEQPGGAQKTVES